MEDISSRSFVPLTPTSQTWENLLKFLPWQHLWCCGQQAAIHDDEEDDEAFNLVIISSVIISAKFRDRDWDSGFG